MDGTLLNSKKRISDYSKASIKRAHDMGVHIVISTGRLYADAEVFSDLIGVKSPIIASNGAVIRGIDKNDIIHKSVFDEELCNKILDIFAKFDIQPIFNTPEKIYTGNLGYKLFIDYIKAKGAVNKTVKTQYVFSWKQWSRVFNYEKNNIVKCEVITKDKEKLHLIGKELESIKELELVNSTDHNIEITRKGVSKGSGMKILSEYFNIKRDEIIAIGDSGNDVSMIEFAGLGVAMGNAMEQAKQVADYVTDTNDNDGVAKVIDKFVLEDESQTA
jgi:Cof subfamily protein (haloacid dehalogenase superfamily)